MANFFPPSVNGIDREVDLNKSIKASLLFDYADLDGNPLEKVRFFDSNGANQSGFFTVNGVQQNAGQWFEVDVVDLDNVRYNGGLIVGNEVINMLVYDGGFWSTPGSARAYSVEPNFRPPEVETFSVSVLGNENILARTMFEASDFDGDPIVKYRVRDQKSNVNSGSFWVNNVKQRQGQWFEFSGEELFNVRYYGGKNPQTETFFVQAYDGDKWSTVESNDVQTFKNQYRPIVSVVNRELETNTVLNIGNMFAWRDRDGNSLKKYSFFDTGVLSDGGFVTVNGIRQDSREWFTVNARDVERGLVKYHSAQVPDNERLRVKVTDGKYFSKVKTFRVDTIQTPDIDTPDNVQVFNDSTHLDLTDWLNQTDSGTRVNKWQFFDATTEKGAFGNELTGSLAYRGNVLEPQRVRTFSDDELADITFKSGVIDRGIEHDEFYVRGNNGYEWSDWQRINTTTVFNLLPAMEKPPAKWGPAAFGTGTTMTFSFMEALPAYYFDLDEDNGSFIPFSPKMRQMTRKIFREAFQDVFDINLVEVSHLVGGTIKLGLIDNIDASAYAYFPPGFGGNPNLTNTVHGDIWVEQGAFEEESGWLDDSLWDVGGSWYHILIHEMGHAMGLAHPFEGRESPGGQVLALPVENHDYTVMSYTGRANATAMANNPASTQLYDNYALDHLYGHETDFNKEDNVYRYAPNEHQQYAETLHDPGGIDTLNFSDYTPSSTIDLREGHHSSVAGRLNNLNISYGTVIENLVAGNGHDDLTGNEADNRIIGGRGNDIIATKGGDDTAIGNEGHDTYVYELGNGKLTVNEDRGGGKDILEMHAFHDNFDSFKQDLTFRKINGRDLQVSLTMNGKKSQGTVTLKNMNWGGSRVETLQLYDNQGDQIGQDMSLGSIFLQATNNLQRFERTDFQDQFGYLAIPS